MKLKTHPRPSLLSVRPQPGRQSRCGRFVAATLERLGAGVLIALLLPTGWPRVHAQKFLPDDPIWEEGDNLPIPPPAEFPGSKLYDLLHKTFYYEPEPDPPKAVNVNTVGGVPNSSWFTNRAGFRKLTLEEFRRGPNQLEGPDLSQPLTIISLKLDGVSPGFQFRDSRGDIYFCKVDVKDYPQMATSAEVISTKFLHAFGYHVPENYLAMVDPSQLVLAPKAQLQGVSGKRVAITEARLKQILDAVPHRPDGRIQVLASRRLPGKILGPFDYLGTRADDPNDIHPHQHQRELRGLRVFASWINHNDSDSANTLDTYIGPEGQGHVRHYLIDFGTTLGSGAVVPHPRRAGHEYFIEKGPMLKALASLGLWTRPWQTVDYPVYPSIGFFGAEIFDPPAWRPDYPNPAFQNMLPEDAFWAARIVMSFSDAMVQAAVSAGELADADAEAYLLQSLLERRDQIVLYYLRRLNPLDEFEIMGTQPGSRPSTEPNAAPTRSTDGPFRLVFRHLGLEAGLGSVEGYRYRWSAFNNQSERRTPLGPEQETREPSLPLPKDPTPYLAVRIRSLSAEPNWGKFVDVYIRGDNPPEVVGVEREN